MDTSNHRVASDLAAEICSTRISIEQYWSAISTTGHLKEVKPAGFHYNEVCLIFLSIMILWLSSDQSKNGVLHKKESHNNKPIHNSVKNPKLGHNYGYVRFLSNGSIVCFSLV